MRRFLFFVLAGVLFLPVVWAQNIPVSLTYTRLYDYLDELMSDGVVVRQTAVRPYTRRQVSAMLEEAWEKDSLLNARQLKDLAFYRNEFALERDTMVDNFVQWTDHSTFSLSLADPQFSFRRPDNLFKMRIRPILGAEISVSKKGALLQRWYGAEIQMDIANHLSLWGSLRDNSWSGNWLNKDVFPSESARRRGAWVHYGASDAKEPALNMIPGAQYKEANYGADFSDSRGGINLYTWWGSIGIQRESIRWGDAYHCSNILSGKNPAVPMITLQLTPCKWFQFDYFHAWLVSNVLDSTTYYIEDATSTRKDVKYRPANKFMAANMFTFTPIKYVSFSLGNSIIYGERTIQAAYLIPVAFYKSLDHLLTKGISSENQNSQAFASLSVRPVDHLQVYGSFFLDEFKLSRLKASDKQKNPISYLVGFNWSGWPVKGLSLKGEFMRSYIACYTHSINVLTYASNGYNMGHYMGDNAQNIYAELAYRPIRGLLVSLSYTGDTKYNSYAYYRKNIGAAISQKPFDKVIYRNDIVRLDGVYEVHPNMYMKLAFQYNNARGFDNLNAQAIESEDTGSAQHYLNRFSPLYYQGKNFTVLMGFSFGF